MHGVKKHTFKSGGLVFLFSLANIYRSHFPEAIFTQQVPVSNGPQIYPPETTVFTSNIPTDPNTSPTLIYDRDKYTQKKFTCKDDVKDARLLLFTDGV